MNLKKTGSNFINASDNELYKLLFDEAPDSMFIIRPNGRFITANARGLEITGYSLEDMRELLIYNLIRHDRFTQDSVKFDQIPTTGIELEKGCLHKKNGVMINAEISIRLLSDLNILIIIHDNCFDRREKPSQHANSRFYECNFGISETPVIVLDGETLKLIECNRAAAEIFKVHPISEASGKTILDLSAPVQSDGSPSSEKIRFYIERAHREGILIFEWIHQRISGEIWHAEWHVMRLDRALLQITIQDITERKRAEEGSLLKDRALASSVNAVVINSLEGQTIYINSAFLKMYGYSHDEASHLTAYDLAFTKEGNERIFTALQTKGCFTGEDLARRKDGSPFPVAISACIITDRKGVPIAMMGSFFDLSERKRAEETLLQAEDKFAKAFRLFSDSLSLTNLKTGVFIDVNEGFERTFGYTREEVIGKSSIDLRIWNNVQDRSDLFERLLKDGRVKNMEAVGRRKSGDLFTAQISGEVLQISQEDFILVIVRDISGQKQTELELQQEKLFTKAVIDSIPGLLYLYDEKRRLVRWNKGHEDLTGYTSEELNGFYLFDWFGGREPDTSRVLKAMDEVFKTGYSNVEANLITKDGRSIPFLFTGVQLKFAGKLYLTGIGIDITERERSEEERRLLQEQLSQSQKMESIGRLAGGVAHDFNNMLGVILGHAELAMEQIDEGQPIKNELQQIQKAALHSADLTRKLLAFARKQTIAPKTLDLNETVEGMYQMLKRLIGEEIELIWKPGENLCQIKIDPSQIDQILANLCVNAKDAIAGAGVMIIETGNVAFDETYCADHSEYLIGSYVMLAVSDNGCGMTRDILDHIFEPFFSTKKFGLGTGLGLATVYGIVKQNDGFIKVTSEPGRGTTFRLYFHQTRGRPIAPPDGRLAETPKGRGETILMVEDEEAILQVGKKMLTKLGYNVLTAQTPDQALESIENSDAEIHLLITDIVMPGMNGRELAERIKILKPGIKCLFISGYTSDIIAHRGVLDEGVNFLQKPFSLKDLATTISRALA